jgi:hypothetical protein
MNAHDDMSDTDVLSAARDSLSGMPVAGPPDVEAIMARGRARRHRRMIPAVTGTLAVAAGAALAVTALGPANHQASRQPIVRLAAWTVTKLADGNISVTIRELKDPAGLQSTLRADGVPASVTLLDRQNPACQPYPGGIPVSRPVTPLLEQVFPEPYKEWDLRVPTYRPFPRDDHHSRPPAVPPNPNDIVIVIDPSALPGNAGVQLAATYINDVEPGLESILPQVVYASSQCTGS